ncbi:MAG: hypothetical protein HRT89_01360 [Lentisphaeria bacterium]|nr:hypothetical protein [Lentisphaeria bacterium]
MPLAISKNKQIIRFFHEFKNIFRRVKQFTSIIFIRKNFIWILLIASPPLLVPITEGYGLSGFRCQIGIAGLGIWAGHPYLVQSFGLVFATVPLFLFLATIFLAIRKYAHKNPNWLNAFMQSILTALYLLLLLYCGLHTLFFIYEIAYYFGKVSFAVFFIKMIPYTLLGSYSTSVVLLYLDSYFFSMKKRVFHYIAILILTQVIIESAIFNSVLSFLLG